MHDEIVNTDLIRFILSFEFANPLFVMLLFVCIGRWGIDWTRLFRSASCLLHDPQQVKRERRVFLKWNWFSTATKMCRIELERRFWSGYVTFMCWFAPTSNQSWIATSLTYWNPVEGTLLFQIFILSISFFTHFFFYLFTQSILLCFLFLR